MKTNIKQKNDSKKSVNPKNVRNSSSKQNISEIVEEESSEITVIEVKSPEFSSASNEFTKRCHQSENTSNLALNFLYRSIGSVADSKVVDTTLTCTDHNNGEISPASKQGKNQEENACISNPAGIDMQAEEVTIPLRKKKVLKSYIALMRKHRLMTRGSFMLGVTSNCYQNDPFFKVRELERKIYKERRAQGYTCLRPVLEVYQEYDI